MVVNVEWVMLWGFCTFQNLILVIKILKIEDFFFIKFCVRFIFFAAIMQKVPLMAFIYSWFHHRLSFLIKNGFLVRQQNMLNGEHEQQQEEKNSSVRLWTLNVILECNEASNVKFKTIPIFSKIKLWIEFGTKEYSELNSIWILDSEFGRFVLNKIPFCYQCEVFKIRYELFCSDIWRLWYSKPQFS